MTRPWPEPIFCPQPYAVKIPENSGKQAGTVKTDKNSKNNGFLYTQPLLGLLPLTFYLQRLMQAKTAYF
jgi:hypothetical protein